MSESLLNQYIEEYSSQVADLFDAFLQLNDEIEDMEVKFTGIEKKYLGVSWKYSMEIDRYIQSSQDSLGNDVFVARYNLFFLLIYMHIIQEKELNETDYERCVVEIESRFYVFLNCIYNIKEKLERLFNINDKNKDLHDSVLTNLGKKSVLSLFKKSYSEIKEYCNARAHIVHDIYQLHYDKTKNCINISYSVFDLSEDRLAKRKKKKYTFFLNELIEVLEKIQILRKEVVIILSNVNNINLDKLKDKFFNEDLNSIVVKF
jgi:hypothetical protein